MKALMFRAMTDEKGKIALRVAGVLLMVFGLATGGNFTDDPPPFTF